MLLPVIEVDLFLVRAGGWATLIGSIGALGTAAVAFVISRQLKTRERRQAIASIHYDLTTGEAASARDVIGTLLYGNGLDAVPKQDAIAALFRLYWAIQRAENTYRVHELDPVSSKKLSGQQELFLSWNFREIVQNIVAFHDGYGEKLCIEDADAWNSFEDRLKVSSPDLYEEFLAHRPSVRWAGTRTA
ncbi:hypothetical protein [Cryobacterium sp. N19]|uniref:hypothetical protein n=1 Tax=Cryobacterium sp. N19 TaxID=2048288 RepID=UPI000CE38EBC|nr:hypothetical protein [Cryobacterium sp. N19]